MAFWKGKTKKNPVETEKQPTNSELSAAILELSNEIVSLRTQFAKLQGRFGGRPLKFTENVEKPTGIVWENATHYIGQDHILKAKTWQ